MKDEFLLELYRLLTPDARSVFDALRQQDGPSTMEKLMLAARITNQQIRKGVWGLACTGLITYSPGRPIWISDNGARLASLLAEPGTNHRIDSQDASK